MSKTLLQNARLIDPVTLTDQPGSVMIVSGRIEEVFEETNPQATGAVEVIDCQGKCLAPGIIDIGVKVSEPGERHKESFRSAGRAAAAGGVTTIVTRPDTLPAIDTPETLEFVAARANEDAPVNVLPQIGRAHV